MARQERQIEGDADQQRKNARAAKAEGKRPSEMGATHGSSKQTKHVSRGASHGEKMETKSEGKRTAGTSGKPRPGNRDKDPKRTNRWG